MQPFCTTLGAEGRRPDGCHKPLCAAGAGPFGNTGKHRPGPGPDPDRAERRLNPQARQGVSSPYYTTNFPTKKEAAGAASFLYVISGQPDKP